jgi:tetratricopeptide (TPR) repeat protein
MPLPEHAARLIAGPHAADGAIATDGDAAEAARRLRDLIFGSPASVEAAGLLAELAARPQDEHSLDALAAHIDDALADNPSAASAALGLVAAVYQGRASAGSTKALLDLGDLLEDEDDDAARAAYERAAMAGESQALVELAYLLRRNGDDPGAEAAVRQAIVAGDPEVVPWALITLALVLQRRDSAGAKAALYRAIETGHPQWAGLALQDLGHVLERDGDYGAARAAFEQAINAGAGDQERTAEAAYSLACLLDRHGAGSEAQAAWQRVFETGHYHYAASAAQSLMVLLRNDGDLAGVRALYQAAVAAGNDAALEVLVTIGDMLEERGDNEGARAALQQAIDDGYLYADDLLERLHPSPRPSDAELAGLPSPFNPRNMLRTGIEVLEHGLPALPAELSYLMAIPVAYWTAEHCAVVQFLTYRRHGRSHNASHVQVTYERVAGSWRAGPGAVYFGHGPVHDPIASPGDRREMSGNLMVRGGGSHVREVMPGQPAAILSGRAAQPIARLALVQDDQTDKRRLDSHFGAWVVCTESPSPFQVQGLDQDGNVIAAISHPFRPLQ